MDATTTTLHTYRTSRLVALNRLFALSYTCAILSLLYHHALKLLHSTTLLSFFIFTTMLLADIILAFMWATTQSFRIRPLIRQQFPQNLHKVIKQESEFPAIDIFICTADPYKEPPMSVVNTALSVMAYDYPADKISVYVSDDGGSELTLFAFMEAAKFGRHWLTFCRENNVTERSPQAFFGSNYTEYPATEEIKIMYESMKTRVENVVEKGKIEEEYITNSKEREAFNKWTSQGSFTRQDHPTVIEVLLESGKDNDTSGHSMPNLVYVSRHKGKATPHHFKAGALNTLVRVSSIMTNAPIILTLDCDMYSNDPKTMDRVLCYLHDPSAPPTLGYVQFPQCFHGLNKADIYASELKHVFNANPSGMDGLAGTIYVGTGCFFRRRVFFGGPSSFISPEIKELSPDHVVHKPIKAHEIQVLAHHVACSTYENETNWGYKMGFRYGSLVEDFYTGYHLQCEGWTSVFCHPTRPAFLGDIPITLADVLSQNKRWSIGLLEVGFCRFSPITFGARSMGLVMGLCYAHYAFWPIWSIPITIYSFIPQLALLNKLSIFPKVTDPWFLVYTFLFVGSYAQDCIDFILADGTFIRWWSDQRMWLIRGVSSYLFGSLEFAITHLGIPAHGFNVTSKVQDEEQSKRYDQGIFEFGIASSIFMPLVVSAVLNLIAFITGFSQIFLGGNLEGLSAQIFIAGFGVMNCLPIYEAMIFRGDKGKMPTKVTFVSTITAWGFYVIFSFLLKM